MAKGQTKNNPNRSFGVKGISLLEKRLTEPTLLEMDGKRTSQELLDSIIGFPQRGADGEQGPIAR